MGCFLRCLGSSSKDHKRKKLRNKKVIPEDQVALICKKTRIQDILTVDESWEQSIQETLFNPVQESSEKKTEVPPLSLKRHKKVTFDTNVTTYEHIQVYDSTESLLERNEKGETFPKEDSVVLSNSNYRYGNCLESDDELEDDYEVEDDDYDLNDDDDFYDADDGDEDEVSDPLMESKRNARNENGYILSVLNPVENLDQWKALKSKGITQKPLSFNGEKENSFEYKNHKQETAIDASLSNWLISSQKNARNNKRVACCNSEFETKTTA